MARRVAVKLSGRVFGTDAVACLAEWAETLAGREGIQPMVVAGGGSIARHYIGAARSLGANEATLDQMGIQVSRLNARLLVSALGAKAYPEVPATLSEVSKAAESGLVVVAGGLYPGQSTNGTAALIAERVGAEMFLNATDVDGVYDSDPRVDADARMFDSIRVGDLREMLVREETVAGGYDLMDLVALKVIERSSIPTRIMRATPANLRDAIRGAPVGTEITF